MWGTHPRLKNDHSVHKCPSPYICDYEVLQVVQNIFFEKFCDLPSQLRSKNCTLNCTFQAHTNMCCLGFCSVIDCLNYIVPITMHRLLRNHLKIHFTDCVEVAYWRRKLRMRGRRCFVLAQAIEDSPLDHI